MTTHHLQHTSKGVVHRTPHRTRLRVPKEYRSQEALHPVKLALESVGGVNEVDINPHTGSILVKHEAVPEMLTHIGAAIASAAPELLISLVMPEELEEVGVGALSDLFGRYVLNSGNGATGKTVPGSPSEETVLTTSNLKKLVPMLFLAAGAYKLIQTESLLGGIAPVALFYYAFDSYWKFKTTAETESHTHHRDHHKGDHTE